MQMTACGCSPCPPKPEPAPKPIVDGGCCGKDKPSPFLERMEVVCRVALGVLCMAISPFLFGVSMTMGAIGGLAYKAYVIKTEGIKSEEPLRKPVCAQGFMEMLSGMKFNPKVNLIATAVFVAAHIRHDPIFFVPFTGLFIGSWVGRNVMAVSYRGVQAILK